MLVGYTFSYVYIYFITLKTYKYNVHIFLKQHCALVWTIWNCRNEVVFNRCANPNFLQVIHTAASLIHLWSYLLPVEQREPLDTGCDRLMAVVRAIFNQGGWLQSRRIGDVA
jgi:hypothetical protein